MTTWIVSRAYQNPIPQVSDLEANTTPLTSLVSGRGLISHVDVISADWSLQNISYIETYFKDSNETMREL